METFLQVCECAWSHLMALECNAIRATCREGRLLHDRLISYFSPSLLGPVDSNNGGFVGICPRAPSQLRQFVSGLLQRGAKPRCLQMAFYYFWLGEGTGQGVARWPPQEREAQLLAVLEACSSFPPTALTLVFGIPHTTAISKAVAACCPHLSELVLDYVHNDLPGEGASDTEEYAAGVVSLLREAGPRLRKLQVENCNAQGWPPEGMSALQCCTALTSLCFTAEPGAGSLAMEARMLSTITTLTQLRSVNLNLADPTISSPDAARHHAATWLYLSALTALTSLKLELSDCYKSAGDSWRRQQQDGEEHEAWEEVREVQRTSLLSALRAMPQLQHLDCRTLSLRLSEAAFLTALTSLTLGGLLPPPQQPHSNSAAAPGALPPQLRALTLAGGTSPTLLAAWQPPPGLTQLHVSCIRFGTSDVSPELQLRPEMARCVSLAAELLARLSGREPFADVAIVADCGDLPMQPPVDAALGHVEWIRGLAPLGTWLETVKVEGVRLHVGDLVCLVSTLPQLRTLELSYTHLPPGALHALTGLQQLHTLRLDLTHWRQLLDRGDLVATLSLLCRGIPSLTLLQAKTWPVIPLNADACSHGVMVQLVAWGIRAPSVTIQEFVSEDD